MRHDHRRGFGHGQGGEQRVQTADLVVAEPGTLMRPIESVVEADSVLGSRWQVSTQAPRIPESYKQIVPLPVVGRVDR